MSLFDKVSRLNKIPSLLKYKEEEEEERRQQKRREQEDKRAKYIEDEVMISQESKAHLEVKRPPNPFAFVEPEMKKKKEEGVGEKLDLRI